MTYLVLSIFVLLISLYLFNIASGSMTLTQLNMISFNCYFHLLLQSFVGVNIVMMGIDNHYLLGRITSSSVKLSAYYSVILVLLLMPISMLFLSYIFRFNAKTEWNMYRKKELGFVISKDDKAVFFTLIIFSIISFATIIYTFVSIGTFPILYLFSDSSSFEANRIRIIASREFEGIVYIRNIFGITLTPILSYIAFSYTKKSKYLGWRILFIILLILSILILTYSLAKAPVLLYILSFIILNVYINGEVSFSKIIRYIVPVILIITFFYLVMSDGEQIDFLDINSGPLGRVLLGQITSLYFHFSYFPDILPYLKGQSFPSFILKLFDIDSVRSARIVMELVNPRGVELGIAGVMNTLFIAEAYANFGWIGIFFSIIMVGFVIQFIYIFFLRVPKNPITVSLFTYLSISLPITGGFFDFIYNPGILIVLFLLLLFYLISLMVHKMFVSNKNIYAHSRM